MSASDSDLCEDPGGNHRPVTEMWLVVVVHGPDDESVAGMRTPEGGWMPLMVATAERVPLLRDMARRMVRASLKPARIVHITSREILETYHPDGRRTVHE